MNTIKLLGFLTGIFFFGCDSENISPSKMVLSEIITTDGSGQVYKFEYENNRLSQFTRKCGEEIITDTEFYYENEQLTKVNTHQNNGREISFVLQYGSEGFMATEKTTIKQDGVIISNSIATFVYNEAGELVSKSDSTDYPGMLNRVTEFEWTNGNISKMNFFFIENSAKNYSGSRSFTYDTKRNFTNNDFAFLYTDYVTGVETILSRNNILSRVDIFSDILTDRGSYSYTYNKSGYPQEAIYKVDGHKFPPVQMKYQ